MEIKIRLAAGLKRALNLFKNQFNNIQKHAIRYRGSSVSQLVDAVAIFSFLFILIAGDLGEDINIRAL